MVERARSTPAESTDRPLRVLRLIARLNIGGPARHTVILNDRLRDFGFETLLVHGSPGATESNLEDLARDRGIDTIYVTELGRRIHPLDDLKAFVRVLRIMRRWRPDIVHTHTAKAGSIGRVAAFLSNLTRRRSKRCVIVHTFHGHVFAGYFGTAGSLAVRVIERTLALMTDRIIAISDRQRNDLVDGFRITSPSRVSVVPLGLDLDDLLQRSLEFRGVRSTLAFGERDVVIGFVGRLVPIKDVETFIRAAALASERLPALRVVIAGDGECRGRLEELARNLGIGERVRFLGWRRDLLPLYASFDLFVLSSLNEGTPVALIEAMAAGVPVIATSVGGVPDVLHDGENGTLVPARDPISLANAICTVAADPQRSRSLAENARATVSRRYNSGRLVEDIARLYTDVVGRNQ
jgi:glycosyltransferase involved in cell wall biosynthesis